MTDRQQKHQLIVLGSGTSTGIPMIGCTCPVCTSRDNKDKRLRTSIYIVAHSGTKILVDTTPDLRTQLLQNNIHAIDGVIITHEHADHIHGIDDLRPLCFGHPPHHINIYTSIDCATSLKNRFRYIFDKSYYETRTILGGGIPLLKLNEVAYDTAFKIGPESFLPFSLPHGEDYTLGFLHSKLAYLTDCHDVPLETIKQLKEEKLDLLIIDCLKIKPHNTHLNIAQAFEIIKQIAPSRAGLIHMSHDLSHLQLLKLASDSFAFPVFPLFDGQILDYL